MNLPAYAAVEVTGVITKLEFGNPTTFNIYCPNSKQSFEMVCNMKCNLRLNDTIYAMCMVGEDKKLHISRPPFAQPPTDKESIIRCFIRWLRLGHIPASQLFAAIAKVAHGEENVVPFLTEIGQIWNDTHKQDILFMINVLDPDNVKKLLTTWHKERTVRSLELFGLDKDDINACRLRCDSIYRKCLANPYTLAAIPLEKCDSILARLNKTINPADRLRGSIIRVLWKNLKNNKWTGTPTRILAKQFPETRQHINELRGEYGLIVELETAYLKFPHDVETFMANYIIRMCQEDNIKYDTPLDIDVTDDSGKIIHRKSASFTRTLSPDQQKAVQGALDHKLSIMTGGSGVGKCIAIGTLVLMFDGSIRKVENLKAGDQLMGPDSKPRTILSTCYGMNNLFEIIPSKGRPFVCNAPHVLTLKGITPYMEFREEKVKKHIVKFSKSGKITRKAFMTEDEAQAFKSSLPEDIFDIPLNEYMARTPYHRANSYLFHVGVNFPSRPVPMDPYLIGYWLGDGTSSTPEITTVDPEIVEVFRQKLLPLNVELNDRDGVHFSIRAINSRLHGCNAFRNVINSLNLMNNKHIPDIYKINSREVRLQILAGLIDSDGYVDNNSIEIIQKNVKLSEDIEYLAFSLGFMVTRRECTKGCMWKGTMRYGQYQRMCIFGEGTEEIPVVLERKECGPRLINKRATCQRFEVNPIGRGLYAGFELDGDGRFLLSDFLVTHNTTCINQIVHNLELRGISYAICAFVGKAVARIREVTKKKNPATIHRLIQNTKRDVSDKKWSQFEKDIPLNNYEHVIIDEASMVTTELIYDFLQSYPDVKRITFVGDVNQLEPIGWGSLFHQMLKSETIPTYRLTTNYRVYTADGERDGVILNANALVNHVPEFPFEYIPTSNFNVIEGPIEMVFDILKGCFAASVKADQIVILSPYTACLNQLNVGFQDIYNTGARYVIDHKGRKFMVGDRVMLNSNDADIGVFNGESGFIKDVSDVAILVDFANSGCHEFLLAKEPPKRAGYPQIQTKKPMHHGNLSEEPLYGNEEEATETARTTNRLDLAYALTIDKSQGSEWDFVIIYISEFTTSSFINRNRIYTALTRTKRAVWVIVSDLEAFNLASVKSPGYRCDNLSRRLTSVLPNLKPYVYRAPVAALEMDSNLPPEDAIPVDELDVDYDDF